MKKSSPPLDYVIDTLGEREFEKELSILRKGGILISLRNTPNGLFAKEKGFSPAKQLLFSLAGMKYDSKAKKDGKAYRFMFVREDGALLEKITDIVEKRNIRPSIDPHKFTLSDINEALSPVGKGHTKVKVIIYFD